MIFSSSTFLLAFLPVVLVLYFLIPTRPAKNVLILLASLLFYAWGEPVYVFLMIASIVLNWLFALAIDRTTLPLRKRFYLVCILMLNLSILGFFKYESFLAKTLNVILGGSYIPDFELPLPIGISFFTLQAVSYIVDVYRGEVKAQRNLLYLGMYISMFPQLIAGPIVRYQTIRDQILDRKENLKDFSAGMRLFIVGLSKKVLLANIVAILADKMLNMGGQSIGFIGAWSGLIAYSFQIFFDFSGYSDMAIGLGKMFGFKYLRNFNYPYMSKSVTEFWHRWHISLSSFFRDYLYIPLGGNRVSKIRWCVNLSIVWGLTGLWHGAAWNFLAWGLFYGIILVLEKLFLGKAIKKVPRGIQHLYCILIFMFGWLIFWIDDPSVFLQYFLALFGMFGLTGSSTSWELTSWEYWPVFIVCIFASIPTVPYLRARIVSWSQGNTFSLNNFMNYDLPNEKMHSTDHLCEFNALNVLTRRKYFLQIAGILADLCLLILFAVSIFSIVSGSFNPFIYFRF